MKKIKKKMKIKNKFNSHKLRKLLYDYMYNKQVVYTEMMNKVYDKNANESLRELSFDTAKNAEVEFDCLYELILASGNEKDYISYITSKNGYEKNMDILDNYERQNERAFEYDKIYEHWYDLI